MISVLIADDHALALHSFHSLVLPVRTVVWTSVFHALLLD